MKFWQREGKSHSDDNISAGGKVDKWIREGKSAIHCRRSNRQMILGRKIRNLNDNEVENSPTRTSPAHGTPPHGTPPSPHPLPLPALQVLLRQQENSTPNNNFPLPSPKDVEALCLERERARERDLPDACSWNPHGSRLSTPDGRRSIDQSKIRSSRRPDNSIYNAPLSAPASPYSSATAPGQHTSHGDPSINQHITPPPSLNVCPARDLPPADSIPGSWNQTFIEKTVFSVDNSLLESPRISPGRKRTCGSASPLPNKLPAESSTTRRESNSQSNVHPLPLPPGATTSQRAPIPEVVPVNNQWQKVKLIGRGTFGSVYVASNRETGALCAMKEVELVAGDNKSAESFKQLEQEIKVLSNLKHPNIVQYYGSEIVGNRFYIYLEYVHPGSLTTFVKDHCGGITESVVRNFTRHILSGLAYLHSTKTIHRDIKGANLLVDAYGVVKLADFGMAKHLNEHRANLSLKGSPYWIAPELLESATETDAEVGVALTADIWSLGCTIIEMLNGKPPWSEYEGVAALFKVHKESPQIPENLSEEAQDFLQCCFRRKPAERPTATMLLEHPFVKGTSQIEFPSTSGTKSGESGPTRKERPSVKAEKMPAPLDIKGKLADNFMICSSPGIMANNVMSRH